MSEIANIEITAANVAQFYTQTADDINRVVTWDEAIAESGFAPEDITYLSSPYTILKGDEKAVLLNKPFYARAWRFAVDKDTERPYVVVHAVTKENDLFILTDGSTGIYAQFVALTRRRLEEGHASPVEHAMIVNGLRVSEYGLNAENQPAKPGEKVTGKGTTYYLA